VRPKIPLRGEASETVDFAAKSNGVGKRDCQRGDTKTSKAIETISEGSVRVKRQRIEPDTPRVRKVSKASENGRNVSNSETKAEDSPVIKLPRMPMIRNGDYWYRARIKQETREAVYVEFTGMCAQ